MSSVALPSSNYPSSLNNTGAVPATSNMDSTFLQLLVTQLKNQDPTQPMDPSSFVSQLVGVNSLEQLIQINQLLQGKLQTAASSTSSPAGGH